MAKEKFVLLAVDAIDEGYRYLADQMNQVLFHHKIELEIDAPKVLPSDSIALARIKLRDAFVQLPELELPADAVRIYPWTLGFLGGRMNREWLVMLADDDTHEQLFKNLLKSDGMGTRDFGFWRDHVVEPIEKHHSFWRSRLQEILPKTELLAALSIHPAKLRLYERLSDGKWHPTDKSDDHIRQRLNNFLADFHLEIEYDRERKRARIVKIPAS